MEKLNPILYFRLVEETSPENGQLEGDQPIVLQTLITRSREGVDCSEHSDITL